MMWVMSLGHYKIPKTFLEEVISLGKISPYYFMYLLFNAKKNSNKIHL